MATVCRYGVETCQVEHPINVNGNHLQFGEQYEDIRRLHKSEGLSGRRIVKLLGISRNTVSRYKNGEIVPRQRKPLERASPVIGPVKETVLGSLTEDQAAPPKQKHTAKRIYERLCQEHGFTGAGSTIRALVRELRGTMRVSIPLQFDPGAAGQVDSRSNSRRYSSSSLMSYPISPSTGPVQRCCFRHSLRVTGAGAQLSPLTWLSPSGLRSLAMPCSPPPPSTA